MKKQPCKIIGLLISLMILPLLIFGEEPITLNYENIGVSTNTLIVYLNSNATEQLTADTLSLTLSGQPLDITSIQSVGQTEEATTYLFMADVSGSISGHNIEVMKQMLSALALKMKAEDNASIMLLGNDLKAAPFVTGPEQVQQQIDSIEPAREDTNLYAGIIQAMNILNTDVQVHQKRYLFVLSDGEDYFEEGYTREEVNEKIKQSHIPVYTIAILDEDAGDTLIESAKILGSFARLSSGGLDITYGLNEKNVGEIVNEATDKMNESYLVTTDLSQVTLENDQCLLELLLTIPEKEAVTESVLLNTSQIKPMIKAETPKVSDGEQAGEEIPQAAKVAEGPESGTKKKKEFSGPMVIIICLIGAGIVIAILVVLIVKRSKKGPAVTEETEPKIEELPVKDEKVENQNGPSKEMEPVPAPDIKIKFIRVGATEKDSYSFEMTYELIIGRNPALAQFALPQDKLLSARHCRIYFKNEHVYLEDLQSTNGTYLNGIPVQQPCILEQDDIILAGSMELRVTWKRSGE